MTAPVLGASKIAAVVGADRFQTPQQLWARMAGLESWEPEGPDMLRGKCLEAGLLDWGQRQGWCELVAQQLQLVHPADSRLGATPDALAQHDGRRWVVDAKAPRPGTKSWDDRSGKYPLGYALQSQWQQGLARLCGYDVTQGELWAGPMAYSGALMRVRVEFDAQLFDLLVQRAQLFLDHVERREPLPVDWYSFANQGAQT